MFTIGESRAISYANETELQAQQVAANPRRGRFSIETLLENADQNSAASGSKKITAKQNEHNNNSNNIFCLNTISLQRS